MKIFLNRFDCHPEENVSQKTCENRGCCWNSQLSKTHLDIPFCYYPQGYSIYEKVSSQNNNTHSIHNFNNIKSSGFPKDVKTPQVQVTCFSKTTLRIRIIDKNESRYEVPYLNLQDQKRPLSSCDLIFNLTDETSLNFQIIRASTYEVL